MSKKSIEYIGYLGMILVVGSFVFNPGTSPQLFSWVNLAGAIVTTFYGTLIKSKPLIIMNVCIGIFDIMHLMGTDFGI